MGEQFRDLVAFCQLPAGFASFPQFLGVSRQTWARWRSGETPPPAAVLQLLSFMAHGDFAQLWGDAWEGFHMGKDGKIYAPFHGNRGFSPDQIKYMFFGFQRLHTLERENAALRSEIDRLESALESAAIVRPQHAGAPHLRLVNV